MRRGKLVETELSGRLMSLTPDELRKGHVVAVAGGTAKPAAIRAVLESGMLHGLLTDERTAQALAGPTLSGGVTGSSSAHANRQ